MEEQSKQQPIDLREVFRPIKARLWLIVVCVSLATALTYYHYSSQPKLYQASTTLYIGSTSPTQLTNPGSSDRVTADLAGLVSSPSVQALAAKELGLTGGNAALVDSVSAAPESGTDFLSLHAVSGSPATAAAVVNAVADAFVTNETSTIHNQAVQALSQAEQQLKTLPDAQTTLVQRGQLLSTIQQMQSIASLPTAGIQHINPATPSGAPFAPNPKQNAIFAFVISLMLAIAGCYALERLDRRIRALPEMEQLYGLPTLVTVPRTVKPTPSDEDGAALLPNELREPFRKLRMNLQLASLDRLPKSIVVTSAVAREGKSTVTRNLALAFREAGMDVCVIDADLRRPNVSRLLNVDNEPGLTDVVLGETSLSSALTRAAAGVPGLSALARLHASEVTTVAPGVPDIPVSSSHRPGPRDVGSLVVLPAGPEPANPPVVLGSDQMRSTLAALSEEFDIVLVDTSPLLAVSDAVPLLSAADGVLIVSRLGMTTRDAAKDLVEQLHRIPGANTLGIVVNDVHGRRESVNRYSYGYEGSRTSA